MKLQSALCMARGREDLASWMFLSPAITCPPPWACWPWTPLCLPEMRLTKPVHLMLPVGEKAFETCIPSLCGALGWPGRALPPDSTATDST